MKAATASRSELADGQSQLSEREIEVLSLIAQGYCSKEAAEILYISKRTVDFHLSRIYIKLGVNNRVQAYRAAEHLGLVPGGSHAYLT